MIQLVINTNMLRELNERKIINAYARLVYNNEEDTSNEVKIKENLINILDWDVLGENGLGFYCSNFESIKRKDWPKLIQIIKDNAYEIKRIAYKYVKKKDLAFKKELLNHAELKEKHNKEMFTNPEYKVSGRGKKARPCTYEGRTYKSRQECMYKENLTQNKLYRYLEKTGQI